MKRRWNVIVDSDDEQPGRSQVEGGAIEEGEESEEGEEGEEGEESEEGEEGEEGDANHEIAYRAHPILQIVAAAAQRVPVNYTSKDGLFAKQMYEELMSSIRFLVPSGSSSTWKHEFMRVLRHSHSIRIHPIQQENKTMVRGEHADRCALCGRAEATCMQLVELAGNANGKEHMGYDAREWSDLERLDEVYENFHRGHRQVTGRVWMREATRSRSLPNEYMGAFCTGVCCLRRLKLAFVAQNLVLVLVGDAHNDLGWSRVAPDITEESMHNYITLIRHLQETNTEVRGPVLEPVVDEEYWKCMDLAIHAIAGDDHWRMRGERARERILDC